MTVKCDLDLESTQPSYRFYTSNAICDRDLNFVQSLPTDNPSRWQTRSSNCFCLFDLILYVPSTIFQLNRDGSSWVESVLSYDNCVLLKDHNSIRR